MNDSASHAVLEEGGKRKKRNVIAGKVYADWCGHCKTLEPEWKKLEDKLSKKRDIKFVEIESAKQEKGLAEIKQKYGVDVAVQGYPTVFKIENGKLDYYEGQRTAEQMADWYVNGGNSNKDQYGLFRGGFKSLHDIKKSYRKKTRTQRKTKTRTAKRRRGFLGFFSA